MTGLIGKQLLLEDHPVDSFTATQNQVNFTLSRVPGSASAILVFVNGVIQVASTNYTVNGATLAINSPTGVIGGSSVVVWYSGIVSGTAGLSGSIASAQATGTGDAQVVSFVPTFSAYTQNMIVQVGAPALSTTTTPTLEIDGMGAKRVYDNSGNDLVAGAIGGKHVYIYDTTLNSSAGGFRLINPLVNNSVPVGSVIQVLGNAAPAGFLKLNGAVVARSTYPALWSFAQASGMLVSDATWLGGSSGSFSSGDLTNTFRLPDLRGEFLRGWDDSRGADSGRTIGSYQADALQGHIHQFTNPLGVAGGAGNTGASTWGPGTVSTTGPITDGVNGTPRTAAETRPRNVAVLLCVKY